jgi:hypothetical protein
MRLTETGRRAFDGHVAMLRSIIDVGSDRSTVASSG